MKVGIDARLFRREAAGIGRYSRELLTRIPDLAPDLTFTVFLTPADFEQWDLDRPNVETVVVPIKHYSLGEQAAFLGELNRRNLDLVHFLNFNHPIRYRKPFVVTLHDLTLYNFQGRGGAKNKLKETAFRMVFEHAMRASKRIVSISQYSANDVVAKLGVSREKIDVVPNGGPPQAFISESMRPHAQSILGGPEPYFLFVSQWRPHKGLGTLIEAFEKLRASRQERVKIVLVGRRDVAPPELIAAIENSPYRGDIVMPGFVDDITLQALYRFSTACVVPSEHEGFGLPLLEAFACGATVIAANNSAMPEVLGDAGLLFETRNAADLAMAMAKLLDDPELRDSLIAKGIRRLPDFSWDQTAAQTLATYRRVLENR